MNSVWSMGGYGAYVWSSFALALIVVVVCYLQGRQRHNRVRNDLRRRIRAMEADE